MNCVVCIVCACVVIFFFIKKDDEVTAPRGKVMFSYCRHPKKRKEQKQKETSKCHGSLSRTYQTLCIKLEF